MPTMSDQERYQHWLQIQATSAAALELAASSDHEMYGHWLRAQGVAAP